MISGRTPGVVTPRKHRRYPRWDDLGGTIGWAVRGRGRERPHLARAQAGDEPAFQEPTDPYRREPQLHCYRTLSWQSHGPRARWFCVVQFEIDRDDTKAIRDREPTTARAMMVAELARDDWSWQPAAAGRMRSGTASIQPVGRAKLRAGAVWVDPTYRGSHELRLKTERQAVFGEGAEGIVLETTCARAIHAARPRLRRARTIERP